jgi:cytochrome c oxidase subunit 2
MTMNQGSDDKEPRHLRRILAIWLPLAAVVDVLFWFLVGPHVPPGDLTSTASSNQFDFNILFVIALPVMIGVWVFLGYSIRNWSAKRVGSAEPKGGAAARGNLRAQVWWIGLTTVIVLFLAGFGTVELVIGNGSGGGEGPNPAWAPTGANAAELASATWSPTDNHVLPVQVIGQQWQFTYRYPTFGGFESSQLILPAGTEIEFNVTSLDVIHSFWAYQLSVKADANPGVNNIAYTKTTKTGNFTVRCSELCGIWHGAMYNYGKVVSKSAFESWATSTETANASNTANLAPYASTYTPDANGAAGGYYEDGTVTPYSTVEVYGAKQPAS